MEITKMLTVSTAHITKETADLLDCDVSRVVYQKDDFGWFIHIPDDFDLEEYDIPQELLKLIKFAKDIECDWLCLDCDAEALEYFETYEW